MLCPLSTGAARRAGATIPRLLAAVGLCLPLLLSGCLGGDEASNTTGPGAEEESAQEGMAEAVSDADGIALVTGSDGTVQFEAELLDPDGAPLSGVQITYLATAQNPVICLNDSASGDPYGMFELVPGLEVMCGDTDPRVPAHPQGDASHEVGVLILELLDPASGHIYDPARDHGDPNRTSTLQTINRVVDFDDLLFFIETTPGVEHSGEFTAGSIRDHSKTYARFFEAFIDSEDPARQAIAQRIASYASFVIGQHDSYRYRSYRYDPNGDCDEDDDADCIKMAIPLGVQAAITIDNPVDGTTYTDPDDRLQELSGAINLPPDVITLDGGGVELYANGVLLTDAVGVGGDGTGEGSLFSTGEMQLAEGQNMLQMIIYVSNVNRGMENGDNGEAGQATVTVSYEPGASAPTAPVLSDVSHPTTYGCPNGVVPVSFHFSDPDGDVVTVYESFVWNVGGEDGSRSGSVPLDELPHLSCLGGTAGDCQVDVGYYGLHDGDWFTWEFWVEDAEGLQSNHIDLTVTITGCAPLTQHVARTLTGGLLEVPGD
ncbi:MAG: hypothetical protein GF330_04095 [Candidatus Eisenbacteria bacterium]|nr:hypothetical protein [Candidatus Eisenbacteria bacterium]